MWKWISIVAASACVLLWSGVSEALPNRPGTYLLCKCTCRAQDSSGKFHYGSSNGIWYTTSHDACDKFPSCTVGQLTGIATDCLGTEKQLMRLSPNTGIFLKP